MFPRKHERDANRPVVCITTGDPAGIGPEVVIKALRHRSIHKMCQPVVVGRPSVMMTHASLMHARTRFVPVDDLTALALKPLEEGIALLSPTSSDETDQTRMGEPSAHGGAIAYESICFAARECLDGRAAAMVTAPINKTALSMAGIDHPGHTELLAGLCGAREVAMMMVGGGLKVVLATIHVALKEVSGLITRERLLRLFALVQETFARLGRPDVRIGVCGLNPHAGEGGLFGLEDTDAIAPAVRDAQEAGLRVTGPHPADTVFHRALRGGFDVVVAMYHDQGLIPVKTLDFEGGINVTIGLPFVRTSVDHGTAYDIAGKSQASEKSMVQAITAAVELSAGRVRW